MVTITNTNTITTPICPFLTKSKKKCTFDKKFGLLCPLLTEAKADEDIKCFNLPEKQRIRMNLLFKGNHGF
jgi:hypothetical protein